MKIIKRYNWSRRDFCYDAKCEHCGNIDKSSGGYDDANYYQNVVPNEKCSKCKKSTNSKESNVPKTETTPRYDKNVII